MRITDDQKNKIVAALDDYLKNHSAELKLYGSRVNDQLKGGDIDLLLVVDTDETEKQLQKNKHYLLSAIKETIGEQKIDLSISSETHLKTDPFLQMILPTSLSLYKWP